MSEAKLLEEIRLELGKLPNVVIWRNSTGVAEIQGRKIRYGLCVGSPDIVGIAPGGRFLGIEVKTKSGRVTKDQRMFIELVRWMGGFAGVARSVQDAVDIAHGDMHD